MKRKTGGRAFDPEGEAINFVVNSGSTQEGWFYPSLLLALNETGADFVVLKKLFGMKGKRIFLDSGVFSLAAKYARSMEISIGEAISSRPSEIEGWDELLDLYFKMLERYGEQSWGYMELDLGGPDTKRETRRYIESLGYVPIPVYHPKTDGKEYFEELASEYDRIAIGNLAADLTDQKQRTRLFAWIQKTRAKYRPLWIHLLGYSPHRELTSFPWAGDSCDSIKWLNPHKYAGSPALGVNSMLHRVGYLPVEMTYAGIEDTAFSPSDPTMVKKYVKARRVGVVLAEGYQRQWRKIRNLYPPVWN